MLISIWWITKINSSD